VLRNGDGMREALRTILILEDDAKPNGFATS
jgi:hypothetical protein